MKKINARFFVLMLMILSAGVSRVMIHPDNFTPLGAMALFGGAYFYRRSAAYLLPLASLLVSDIILQGVIYQGKYGFPLYEGWYWVYGTFALIVLIGERIIKTVNAKNLLVASLTASLAHWLITDFGTWLQGGWNLATGLPYTKDIHGLLQCYAAALHYVKNFLLSTLLYSAVMFGIFEIAQRKFPALATSK